MSNRINAHGFLDDNRLIKATGEVERAAGIEPASSAWEAEVLPLNYARFERSSHKQPGEVHSRRDLR